MGISQRSTAKASAWEQSGRDPKLLETDRVELFKMDAWIRSESGAQDVDSDDCVDFVHATIKAFGDFNNYWSVSDQQASCLRCGREERLRDIWWCADCDAAYCTCCVDSFPFIGRKKSRSDSCGGDLYCEPPYQDW